ncbi:MAG TPA: tyrosine-type recombinase/integrase [Stellaceae bacterium]|jgi:integrase|nr:tyrosine-type recombinase/integrase [Stellaceae bacterium]
MPRFIARLTQGTINGLTPGLHADGGGLDLHVNARGAKSWVFRYMIDRKAYELGLGSLYTIGLKDARRRAEQRRREVLDGINPKDLHSRAARRQQARREVAKGMTFEQCAEGYIAANKAAWKSLVHARQWPATLETYVYPTFGALPVQEIDVGLVMQVLEPIWTAKAETASRVRGRIETVLDYAAARGWREGENPARWRGHLDKLLPKTSKAKRAMRQVTGRQEHHAALAYADVASFLDTLRGQPGIAARALEFLILTATRTGEVIGATWSEIDLAAKVWTIPAERMKAGKEHRVPLSAAALAIVSELSQQRKGDYLFPGGVQGKPLSNMAMLALVKRRMKRDDITPHGFRSTFRDWAAERTTFSAEVAEMALAHTVADAVERAYRRGDLFDKRRRLMEAWAAYCTSQPAPAAVVPIRVQRAAHG